MVKSKDMQKMWLTVAYKNGIFPVLLWSMVWPDFYHLEAFCAEVEGMGRV
jgi:hypothetical protein